MDEFTKKSILTEDTENKAKEVCKVLVDRLYEYFVGQGKEARADTVVAVLQVLTPFVFLEKGVSREKTFDMMEDEVI